MRTPLCRPLPNSTPRLGLAQQTQLWGDTQFGCRKTQL